MSGIGNFIQASFAHASSSSEEEGQEEERAKVIADGFVQSAKKREEEERANVIADGFVQSAKKREEEEEERDRQKILLLNEFMGRRKLNFDKEGTVRTFAEYMEEIKKKADKDGDEYYDDILLAAKKEQEDLRWEACMRQEDKKASDLLKKLRAEDEGEGSEGEEEEEDEGEGSEEDEGEGSEGEEGEGSEGEGEEEEEGEEGEEEEDEIDGEEEEEEEESIGDEESNKDDGLHKAEALANMIGEVLSFFMEKSESKKMETMKEMEKDVKTLESMLTPIFEQATGRSERAKEFAVLWMNIHRALTAKRTELVAFAKGLKVEPVPLERLLVKDTVANDISEILIESALQGEKEKEEEEEEEEGGEKEKEGEEEEEEGGEKEKEEKRERIRNIFSSLSSVLHEMSQKPGPFIPSKGGEKQTRTFLRQTKKYVNSGRKLLSSEERQKDLERYEEDEYARRERQRERWVAEDKATRERREDEAKKERDALQEKYGFTPVTVAASYNYKYDLKGMVKKGFEDVKSPLWKELPVRQLLQENLNRFARPLSRREAESLFPSIHRAGYQMIVRHPKSVDRLKEKEAGFKANSDLNGYKIACPFSELDNVQALLVKDLEKLPDSIVYVEPRMFGPDIVRRVYAYAPFFEVVTEFWIGVPFALEVFAINSLERGYSDEMRDYPNYFKKDENGHSIYGETKKMILEGESPSRIDEYLRSVHEGGVVPFAFYPLSSSSSSSSATSV